MYLYVIQIDEKEDHCRAYNEAFDITVDAPNVIKAVELIRERIINEGVLREMEGRDLPKQKVEFKEGTVIVEVDFNKSTRKLATASVKRTISLPEWMDIEIRNNRIDASKLFQEAFLEKYDTNYECDIESVEDLKAKVDPDILKAYVKAYLQNLL